jgi:hypothetical protein
VSGNPPEDVRPLPDTQTAQLSNDWRVTPAGRARTRAPLPTRPPTSSPARCADPCPLVLSVSPCLRGFISSAPRLGLDGWRCVSLESPPGRRWAHAGHRFLEGIAARTFGGARPTARGMASRAARPNVTEARCRSQLRPTRREMASPDHPPSGTPVLGPAGRRPEQRLVVTREPDGGVTIVIPARRSRVRSVSAVAFADPLGFALAPVATMAYLPFATRRPRAVLRVTDGQLSIAETDDDRVGCVVRVRGWQRRSLAVAGRFCMLPPRSADGDECRGVAQFGRALGSGPRGRRFKSCHPDVTGQRALRRARRRAYLLPGRV